MTTESEAVQPPSVSSSNSSKCKKETASWKTGAVLRGNNALDAEQLYKLLGLLIIEGRVPVAGSKGRIIGPHAYKSSSTESSTAHICDDANALCARAASYRDRLSQFGRLGIPLVLEVLILSDCEHSSQSTMSQSYLTDHSVILEQWTVTLVPKQTAERKVEAIQALLQTVSSYLHFSQLSSWLMRYHGERPKQLHYRLAVYGESSLPLTNTNNYRPYDFPLISAGENKNLQVKCFTLHMPCADVPAMYCRQCWKSHEPMSSSSCSQTQTQSQPMPSVQTSYRSTSAVENNCTKTEVADVSVPIVTRPTCLSTTIFTPGITTSMAVLSASNNPLQMAYSISHDSFSSASLQEQTCETVQYNFQGTPSKLPRHQHHAHNLERNSCGPSFQDALAPRNELDGVNQNSSSTTNGHLSIANSAGKDQTPFPKNGLENLEDIILRFSRLSSAVSPKESTSNSSTCPAFSTRKRGVEESKSVLSVSATAGQLSSSLQQVHYPAMRRSLRERSILFSDSSSNESLDRLTQRGRVLYHQKSSHKTSVVDANLMSINEPYVFYNPPNGATFTNQQNSLSATSFLLASPHSSISSDIGSSHYTLPNDSDSPPTKCHSMHNNTIYNSSISKSFLSNENESSPSSTRKNQSILITPPTYKDCSSVRPSIGSTEGFSRFSLGSKALFNRRTGLPLQSSPAPVKRNSSGRFDGEDSPTSFSKTVRSCFDGNISLNYSATANPSSPLHYATFSDSNEVKLKKSSCVHHTDCNGIKVDKTVDNRDLHFNKMDNEDESICIPRGRTESSPSYQQEQSPLSRECVISDKSTQGRNQYSTSAPAASTGYLNQHSQHLVINFEESMLSGRIPAMGIVDGFRLDIGANNVAISQKHVCLPMKVYFFELSDDNAPSPYLGYVDLAHHIADRRGYRLPKKGTLQLTLFNPTSHVVKVFVVLYDFTDMPANSTTFLRQRTLYMPVGRHRKHISTPKSPTLSTQISTNPTNISEEPSSPPQSALSPASVLCSDGNPTISAIHKDNDLEGDPSLQYPSYLRYLLHMKFQSSHSGRVYMHKDIRIIFSQDKFEFDASLCYDLRSFVEMPSPRYCNKHSTHIFTTPRRNPT